MLTCRARFYPNPNSPKTLNVSRTPVSIALTTLLERGLLQQKNGKFAVPLLTMKDVVDLYTCRLAFDGLATRLAAETISADALKKLERHLGVWENPPEEDDLRALWVADLSFHELIYEVSGNHHLVRFAQIAAELAAVYRRNTIRRLKDDRARSREDVRLEHERILQALADHDPRARGKGRARAHPTCYRPFGRDGSYRRRVLKRRLVQEGSSSQCG